VQKNPDPDWYLDHVLVDALPGGPRRAAAGPAHEWDAWWREVLSELPSDPVHGLAAGQGFAVTAGQLADLGWDPSDIRREVRRGTWFRPLRGVLSPVNIPPTNDHVALRRRHALVSTGAALLRPDHVISGRSAAVLRGLPTFALPRLPILTARTPQTEGRRARAHVRGATLSEEAIGSWFGAPTTTVGRTLTDLARLDAADGLMATDAALREQLIDRAGIATALDQAVGWPGVKQARRILALATPKAGSPLESLTRLKLLRSGFPEPELQYGIGGYEVDFCWPEHRLVLEADGRLKYAGDVLWEEKVRELAIRRCGWQVERVIWQDVSRDWEQTSRRLRPYFSAFPAGAVNSGTRI
jgi:very-short-patch-repair endonuclease